jgi:predicted enzyme related to lactoylglutathione lyase
MPGFEYTTFRLGTDPVAGMLQIRPEMGPLRPHWGTYYTVNNADETARQAVSLGATLCVPVRDIPGVGRFCGITSPQGVMFYAITYLS